MQTHPTISVVIALYNKADYIAATLKSVAQQSYPALEIIVVDDGSSDGSAELIESMALRGLRLIRQTNGGVSRARNTGIAAAQGEWVAFLDADDIWHPSYLFKLKSMMRDGVLAVASTYRSVGAGDTVFSTAIADDFDNTKIEIIDNLPDRWQQGTCLFTSSIVVRSTALAKLLPAFPPGEHMGEDLDLWFRLAERGPIALYQEPLVLRLWVPGSLSSADNPKFEAPYINRMSVRACTGNMPNELRLSTLRYVANSRITRARGLICSGHRLEALRLLLIAGYHATFHRLAVTFALLLLPGNIVDRFQSNRNRRKMIL